MNNICKFPQATLYGQLSVSCFVMETDPSIIQKANQLNNNRIILVIQGTGTLLFDSQAIPVSSGNLLFGFKNEIVQGKDLNDLHYLYIDFGGGRAEDLFYRFDIHRGNRLFEGFDGLIPLWRDSLARAQENTIDLASESILLYSFSRLSPQLAEYGSMVGKILKITEEQFADPNLSLGTIADKLSYNSKYLSHAFKKAIRVNYSEYLRDVRIKYAISLFNEGLDSVKNVSLLSGFSDPLYFSNVFKKNIGLSPREYLAGLQRGE